MGKTRSMAGSTQSIQYAKAMYTRRLTNDVSLEMQKKAEDTMVSLISRIMNREPTKDIITTINDMKIQIANDVFR